ncbi:Abi family protein [Arcobacter vandammei]|uniref:Abi family protein n=1 Tax=Arcobacter vandammei TaxID=2782243 RepID=UPI0018DFC2EF|nr:Abi family protein [Arcobacter vandammei]
MNPTKKQSYSKPFLSIEEQIKQLKSRGMKFQNEDNAKNILENINYYRLAGYWLIFEKNHENHIFFPNTYFEDILNIYTFDRELRILLLEAIERVEISIRTKLAHILSKYFGSHPLLNQDIFLSSSYYDNLSKLKNEINRNRGEIFIKHNLEKYIEDLPPIWVCVEVMSLGQVSHWFSSIKDRKYKQYIAKSYDLDEKILSSFLHHLTTVRNTVAHHSRLWNKKFTVDFILPKFPKELNKDFNQNSRKYIFNTLVMCEYLLNKIDVDNSWKKRLDNLILKYNINNKKMGFK